jgi:hypothetical protein
MDLETLEYLEDRAKRGRLLVNKIDNLQSMKILLGYGYEVRVVAGINGGCHVGVYDFSTNLSEGLRGQEKTFLESAQKRMIDVLIEETDKEIARLEKELAEL